jgi:hypothetical protein
VSSWAAGLTEKNADGSPVKPLADALHELHHALVVSAQVDRGPDDHTVVAVGNRVGDVSDVDRLDLPPVGTDDGGDHLGDVGCLSFGRPVRDQDLGHGAHFLVAM